MFYFHPYLGKISYLTNMFQRGWNHQPENDWMIFSPTVDRKVCLTNEIQVFSPTVSRGFQGHDLLKKTSPNNKL